MMLQHRTGLADFVYGNFPEPHNPIWQTPVQPNWTGVTVGDFVPANFPEPNNPIYRPGYGIGSVGCGGGCGCSDCGMGAIAVPTWAATLPAPLNTSWGPLPVVYWGGIGIAAIFVLPALLGKRRR